MLEATNTKETALQRLNEIWEVDSWFQREGKVSDTLDACFALRVDTDDAPRP